MMATIADQEDFSKLGDMHTLLSAFKAFLTVEVDGCLKQIREACGASGYLNQSNIPYAIEYWSPNVTLEGDTMVMYQQAARQIFKSFKTVAKGKEVTGLLSYLNDFPKVAEGKLGFELDPTNDEHLNELIKINTIYHISRAAEKLVKDDGLTYDQKWNKKYQ